MVSCMGANSLRAASGIPIHVGMLLVDDSVGCGGDDGDDDDA